MVSTKTLATPKRKKLSTVHKRTSVKASESKPRSVSKPKSSALVKQFLKKFESFCNKKNSIHRSDFEDLVSKDFVNTINGVVIGSNLQQFLERVQRLQKKYSSIEIGSPKVVTADNKEILQFDINLTLQHGKKILLHAIAIATIEDQLIAHWSQVAHEKRAEHFEPHWQ